MIARIDWRYSKRKGRGPRRHIRGGTSRPGCFQIPGQTFSMSKKILEEESTECEVRHEGLVDKDGGATACCLI